MGTGGANSPGQSLLDTVQGAAVTGTPGKLRAITAFPARAFDQTTDLEVKLPFGDRRPVMNFVGVVWQMSRSLVRIECNWL
jgi:hypothetical protein